MCIEVLDLRICREDDVIMFRGFNAMEKRKEDLFIALIGTPSPEQTLFATQRSDNSDNRVNRVRMIHTRMDTIPEPWKCHFVVGGIFVFCYSLDGREGMRDLDIKGFKVRHSPLNAQALRSGVAIRPPAWGYVDGPVAQH
jgi:hypothetical protein